MDIDYIILESNSTSELELLLGEKALDGYKAISFHSSYCTQKGTTYTALMVNYGLKGQLEDLLVQVAEKLDAISTSLLLIESNTSDHYNWNRKPKDVPKHVGEKVIIWDKITGGRFLDQTDITLIAMGGEFPDSSLTLVILPADKVKFETKMEE